MIIKFGLVATLVALLTVASSVNADTISGKVVDPSGAAIEGVMVSGFHEENRKCISVFSQSDGSFEIDGLPDSDHTIRARLMGKLDEWLDDVETGTDDLLIEMQSATGEDLEDHRPADSAFNMLKFENKRDKENFKMMCSYCHQIGTIPFRTPETPVDWETMLRRMDGFGGLYKHTQDTIVQRLIETYKDDAIKKWPEFIPAPAPTGTETKAKITHWELGKKLEGSFHDMELGPDGLVYAVNISKRKLITLDPVTNEQVVYMFPRHTHGPHSIEMANDGHMWITMCASGKMVKFDINSKEFTVASSAEAPAKRGAYPHTLRINPGDPAGLVWYTDAGSNSCYSLHPETLYVKEYKLLKSNQAVGAGKGESRGITPYGLDYSPVDGMIWYSKLNGNRIGRIDPNAPDGDIKEWNPPFRGPRRLHVAQDGMVWVPGFGSGVFGKFDPETEEWTVYDLPNAENQIPYALNIDPKGFVWICGTGNDTLNRFDPKTEELIEFRLPMRVSYTREIEFDSEGNVWTSTSGPARHMERGIGTVIKLEILEDNGGGIQLVGKKYNGEHSIGNQPPDVFKKSRFAKLLKIIEATELPADYERPTHQRYVDARIKLLKPQQLSRLGQLWKERERIDPDNPDRGGSFIKILQYVTKEGNPKEANQKAMPKREQKKTNDETDEAKLSLKLQGVPGVSGFVLYDGTRPKRKQVILRDKEGKLSDCHGLHEHGLLSEEMIVGKNNGVSNAFVYVKKGLDRKTYPAPEDPAILNQVGCMFRPRVQGVMIGQEFVMKNGDPVLHNVRATAFRNRPFNIAQPAGSPDRSKVFSRKEKAITINCDLHPWMKAYYFVMDHPYFAVTDAEGKFQINGLPAGNYTLTAWHEELGERDVELRVNDSGTGHAHFSIKPKPSNVVEAKEAKPRPILTNTKTTEPFQPARKFVRKWSVNDLGSEAEDLSGRSTKHGKEIFTEAGCIKCHVVSGQGKDFGPEITQEITKRFKGAKLLEQLLLPSSEIHEKYQTHMVMSASGHVVSGLIVEENDEIIQLLPNPLEPEKIETVKKSEIDQRKIASVSTMPEGLLDTFDRDDILDLLAFIQSGGKQSD